MYDELPSMAALTPLQRNYVLAMASDPFGTPSAWARAAGYKDPEGSSNVRVQGHQLSRNEKIQAAIREVSRSMLHHEGPLLAAAGLLQIARNKRHPRQLQALEAVANRVGLQEKQQIEVVHRDLTGDALMERIAMLAAKHGLDTRKLLGSEKLIEGRATEIGHDGTHAEPIEAGGDEKPQRAARERQGGGGAGDRD